MWTTWDAVTLAKVKPENLTDEGLEAVADSVYINLYPKTAECPDPLAASDRPLPARAGGGTLSWR